MLRAMDRFPQIGGIPEYMALPLGERALYEQYTLDAIEEEAKTPVFRFAVKGGGKR